MNKDYVNKIIRYFIVGTLFLAMFIIKGIPEDRQSNQIVFMLMAISAFSLILENIWITLFLLWTVFLFSFFKFTTGGIYLSNIFFGCILYYITKKSFKKEHVDFFINGFLWFVCANIIYMVIQSLNYDFIFGRIVTTAGFIKQIENSKPSGFMGHQSVLGTLIALAVPVLAVRDSKVAVWVALSLFVPLYFSKTSLCFLMGCIGFLFVMFYKMPRKAWFLSILILILFGGFYFKNVDSFGTSRFLQWHRVLKDCMIHPVTGWGLDSFRNITPQKDFRYSDSIVQGIGYESPEGKLYRNITVINWWDNPHNLYVSLFFEWGIFGLILLAGFLRRNILKFKNAIKYPNVIGLAGFILVFFGISFGHFPIFLARLAVIIIPMFAIFEVLTKEI